MGGPARVFSYPHAPPARGERPYRSWAVQSRVAPCCHSCALDELGGEQGLCGDGQDDAAEDEEGLFLFWWGLSGAARRSQAAAESQVQYLFPAGNPEDEELEPERPPAQVQVQGKWVPRMRTAKARDSGRTRSGGIKGGAHGYDFETNVRAS